MRDPAPECFKRFALEAQQTHAAVLLQNLLAHEATFTQNAQVAAYT